MGIAKRSTAKLGSAESVYDDLRIIRSLGGFHRADTASLEGTAALLGVHGKAVTTELLIESLRTPFTQRVREALHGSDASDDERAAAASLMVLLLGVQNGGVLSVRTRIAADHYHDADWVRRAEDRFLSDYGAKFYTAQQGEEARVRHVGDAVAKFDQIRSCLLEIMRSIDELWRIFTEVRTSSDGFDWPAEPTQLFVQRAGQLESAINRASSELNRAQTAEHLDHYVVAAHMLEILLAETVPRIMTSAESGDDSGRVPFVFYNYLAERLFRIRTAEIWTDLRRVQFGDASPRDSALVALYNGCVWVSHAVDALQAANTGVPIRDDDDQKIATFRDFVDYHVEA